MEIQGAYRAALKLPASLNFNIILGGNKGGITQRHLWHKERLVMGHVWYNR